MKKYNLEKIAKENPDLPLDFIKDCLEGLEDIKNGNVSVFKFRRM